MAGSATVTAVPSIKAMLEARMAAASTQLAWVFCAEGYAGEAWAVVS